MIYLCFYTEKILENGLKLYKYKLIFYYTLMGVMILIAFNY